MKALIVLMPAAAARDDLALYATAADSPNLQDADAVIGVWEDGTYIVGQKRPPWLSVEVHHRTEHPTPIPNQVIGFLKGRAFSREESGDAVDVVAANALMTAADVLEKEEDE